jgi:hypothetical protein
VKAEPRILLDGLVFGEQPRWHAGRLWFSDRGALEIIAVDLEGDREVVLEAPAFPAERRVRRLLDSSEVGVARSKTYLGHARSAFAVSSRSESLVTAESPCESRRQASVGSIRE